MQVADNFVRLLLPTTETGSLKNAAKRDVTRRLFVRCFDHEAGHRNVNIGSNEAKIKSAQQGRQNYKCAKPAPSLEEGKELVFCCSLASLALKVWIMVHW